MAFCCPGVGCWSSYPHPQITVRCCAMLSSLLHMADGLLTPFALWLMADGRSYLPESERSERAISYKPYAISYQYRPNGGAAISARNSLRGISPAAQALSTPSPHSSGE